MQRKAKGSSVSPVVRVVAEGRRKVRGLGFFFRLFVPFLLLFLDDDFGGRDRVIIIE